MNTFLILFGIAVVISLFWYTCLGIMILRSGSKNQNRAEDDNDQK